MTALSVDADLALAGGTFRRLPSEISANPFSGSLLTFAADGYAHELVAGEPFAGVCRGSIATADAATADGSRHIEAISGEFTITATISGVAQDDAYHRREVYASDDATLTFTPTGNTRIGRVIGVDGSKAIILCQTAEVCEGQIQGNETLADAAATLTTAQLNKLLVITPTTGRTLTLPPAADAAGKFLTVKNLAAQVLTLDGNAAETIEGAATFVALDAANDVATFYCNGTTWHLVSGRIS